MPSAAIRERLNTTVEGRSDALQTLVFVHGFGTTQAAWREVAAAFAADFRIMLLDNAGTVGTPDEAFPQHRYLDLRGYANDLVELCDALGVRGAAFVGHSAGAMICALAAIRRPDLASRLVLIGASPRYRDAPGYHGGFAERDIATLYEEVARNYPEWADRFAPHAMGNDDRPHLARDFAADLKSIPADRALTVLCSIFQSDHRDDVAQLVQPTLIVQSRDDAAVPREVAEFLHRQIPRSRLQVIDATGHLPHVSAPHAVIAAIRGFLAEAA
jgi:sigma-B regulation protein RsbQ